MFRSSAKTFSGLFFVLVGSVLISSAVGNYDAEETPQKFEYAEENTQEIEFSEEDLVTNEKLANVDRSNGFIGDLIVGKRQQYELLHEKVFNVANSGDAVQIVNYVYKLPKGTIHYLAVTNLGVNNAAVCPRESNLGSSKARFSVRIGPRSSATLNLLVASSRW